MKKKSTGKKRTVLSPKENLFCHEYISTKFNGSQAAINAGFAPKSARITASKLLTKPNVKKKIDELLKKIVEKSTKTNEDYSRENELIAFACITDVIGFNESGAVFLKSSDEIPRDVAATIESISFREDNTGVHFKIKMHSKTKAIELGMRERGMLKDKVEQSGEITINLVNYGDNPEGRKRK